MSGPPSRVINIKIKLDSTRAKWSLRLADDFGITQFLSTSGCPPAATPAPLIIRGFNSLFTTRIALFAALYKLLTDVIKSECQLDFNANIIGIKSSF